MKTMTKFIIGLIAAMIVMPTAAPANNTTVFAIFDIRNKSDQCVSWQIPNSKNYGFLHPGESAVNRQERVGNAFSTATSVRIEATVQDCTTRRQIGPMRYDYIPVNSRSELSIHKQSPGVYIMRHGP